MASPDGTGAREPMLPVPYRVTSRQAETHDSVTLRLDPVGERLPPAQPGQFSMLAAPRIGEVAISASGVPPPGEASLEHTIRAVGAVSRALHDARPGTILGVRGPFGTTWDLPSAAGRDLVIVAGGVGLAPLRPVILGALAERDAYRRICLVAGARTPAEFLFRRELDAWACRPDLEVDLTIDQPSAGWDGQVGFVTEPLARLRLDPRPYHRVPVRPRADDAVLRPGAAPHGDRGGGHPAVTGTQHAVRHRPVRALPARADPGLPGRPGRRLRPGRPAAQHQGAVMTKPSLAVWKLASCDGCQLTLLDCEDELLTLPGVVSIAHFLEASSAVQPGPYDISLVEGSITTARDAERILQIREQSRILVTIGACATAGGIQALRNFGDVAEFTAAVYASPEYIDTLATSTPVAAHVPVDFELRGCPIDRRQLLEVLTAFLAGRKPGIPDTTVCTECKRRGLTCVMVADGTPCLGPVTHAGCGALCPAQSRGCYGCFGPASGANVPALAIQLGRCGMGDDAIGRVFATFNAAAPGFADRNRDEPHQ